MRQLFDFIMQPLYLPINPLYSVVGMFIIGEIALNLAYYIAGELGTTSAERRFIHWIMRGIIYVTVWLLACGIIVIVNHVRAHLSAYIIGLFIALGLCFICTIISIMIKRLRHNHNITDHTKGEDN